MASQSNSLLRTSDEEESIDHTGNCIDVSKLMDWLSDYSLIVNKTIRLTVFIPWWYFIV